MTDTSLEHGIRLLAKAHDIIEVCAPDHPVRWEIDEYFDAQPTELLEAILRETMEGDYRKARGVLKDVAE